MNVFIASGGRLGVPVHVFGPETHMTAIVGMALGKRAIPDEPEKMETTANFLLDASGKVSMSLQMTF